MSDHKDLYLVCGNKCLVKYSPTAGIHVGSEEPTDSDILVWIDPNGESSAGSSGSSGSTGGVGITSVEIEKIGCDDEDDGCGCTPGENGVGITDITITEE